MTPCEPVTGPGYSGIVCGRGAPRGPSEEDVILQDIRRTLAPGAPSPPPPGPANQEP